MIHLKLMCCTSTLCLNFLIKFLKNFNETTVIGPCSHHLSFFLAAQHLNHSPYEEELTSHCRN